MVSLPFFYLPNLIPVYQRTPGLPGLAYHAMPLATCPNFLAYWPQKIVAALRGRKNMGPYLQFFMFMTYQRAI